MRLLTFYRAPTAGWRLWLGAALPVLIALYVATIGSQTFWLALSPWHQQRQQFARDCQTPAQARQAALRDYQTGNVRFAESGLPEYDYALKARLMAARYHVQLVHTGCVGVPNQKVYNGRMDSLVFPQHNGSIWLLSRLTRREVVRRTAAQDSLSRQLTLAGQPHWLASAPAQ